MSPSALIRSLVRTRTEGFQDAHIVILRGRDGALDRTTGLVSGMADPETVYRGQARIRPVNGNRTVSIGGGEVVQRDTIVSIPITVSPVPQVDDLVVIVANSDADPSVDDMALRVLGVDAGGYFGDARRISCAGFGRSKGWG